jgi:hypothetical protein
VTLFVDGHVESHMPSTLADMRMWVDAADKPIWRYGY